VGVLKAISPLIAAAILLVITVAGGVIIYNYVMNTLQAPQQYASISIVSAKMLIDENNTILNVKITNIGTASATIKYFEIIPDKIVVNTSLTIDPGVTKSVNIYLNKTLDPNTKHYIIAKYGSSETEPIPIRIIS
jgi:hypothetical protein